MAVQAHVKERPEHKPLPLPNTDFYEVTETLNAEELALLKQVRAFMKAKVAPVTTKHWAEDSFAFELLPAFRELAIGGPGMWKTVGNPEVTPALKQMIADGVLKEAANRSVEQLAKEENELLIELLRLREQEEKRTVASGAMPY
jgi:alkylation response protein AidB-like acyl-CoA dehydrogenase